MKNAYFIFKIFGNIFFKDKMNLFMIFFFNAFLMIIFGISVKDSYNMSVEIGIVDNINSERTNKAIAYLEEQPNVSLTLYSNELEVKEEVKLGKLIAGVVIDSIRSENKIGLSLVGDSSRIMWLEFLNPILKLSLVETDNIKEKIDVKFDLISSSNIRYFDYIFPGLLIFSIMQIGLSGGIMLLVHRKNENLKRLQITPLRKWEFLLGYSSCYLSIMIIQVLGYILIAYLLFGYVFIGNIFNVSLILVFASLFFVFLGIVLCNLSNTVENGNNFNRFFIFPASFLCGVFIPLTTLPIIIQKIALIHPLTYFVYIIRNISNYDTPLSEYYIDIGLLSGMFLIILLLSIFTFKWQQKTA
jgi:ABC-type multidrug transport system permease subunit